MTNFYAPPVSQLPLESLREILGYQPYHWWGLANETVRVNSACNTILSQYAWNQADMAGRSEIAGALLQAEQRLAAFLKFAPAPRYTTFTVPYRTYYDQMQQRRYPVDSAGGWLSVVLPEGYIQEVGAERLTLLDTPVVVYADSNGDGVNDTFTVTAATVETDPTKIAVYFSSADRLDSQAAGDRWKIAPIQVSINGGVATIRGKSWLLVKPLKYEDYSADPAQPIDPSDSANFVTTLDVYSQTTSQSGTTAATSQGRFNWNSNPIPVCGNYCCSVTDIDSSDPATIAYAVARVGIKDSRRGIVIPGRSLYDSATGKWSSADSLWCSSCPPADTITIRALAGYPLDTDGRMNRRLARAVAYLALAEMPKRICACEVANRTVTYWQAEMNRLGNAGEMFAVSRRDLNNPFGMRRGHVYAYHEIEQLKLVRGVSA